MESIPTLIDQISALLIKYEERPGYESILPVFDVVRETLRTFHSNATRIRQMAISPLIIENPQHRQHQLLLCKAIEDFIPGMLQPLITIVSDFNSHDRFRHPKEYIPQLVAMNNKIIFLNSFTETNRLENYVPTTLQLIEDIHGEFITSLKIPREICHEIQIGGNVTSNLKTFYHLLGVANSFVGSSYEEDNVITRGLMTIFSSIYYFFRPERSAQKAMLMTTQPDIHYCRALWDLPDTPIMKLVSPVVLPSVTTNMEFCVETASGHYVSARLISPFKHKVMSALKSGPATQEQLDLTKMPWRLSELPETPLIVHFHGGGFMAMSPASHQTYTRRWVNQTNLPLVSVDYRKAPEHPYPAAHFDCISFYQWLLEYSHALGIRMRKIIFVGDSAGGNLVISTCLKAISLGIRIPDAIIGVYPAIMLSRSFSPSRLFSLDDPLVSAQFLDICMKSVIPPTIDPVREYFLSPLMAPRDLLEKLPPTYLSVGKKDPLFDDAFFFAKRLCLIQGSKSDQSRRILKQMRIYQEVGHAYLNLVDLVPELEKPISDVSNWIKVIVTDAPLPPKSPEPERTESVAKPSPALKFI
eukprot:TRINITY_DN984_c0_g1_i1.p1 TRINITY_DN984_c0_g1~~TRINITY_DN984_c0_g1_i1.p1  ORF type:complete len:584 (-),score=127.55 TRINITY_DN984_c0_g1_i1:2193-3944(-)